MSDPPTLLELLRSAELWRFLAELVTELRGSDYDFTRSPEVLKAIDYRIFGHPKVQEVLQRLVVDRLPRPVVITSEDILGCLRQQLSGICFDSDSDEFQHAMNIFCVLVINEAEPDVDREGDIEISLGTWLADSESEGDKLVESYSFWTAYESNFILNTAASPTSEGIFKVTGEFFGGSSDGALAAAEQWVSRYAPSIAKTSAWCSNKEERQKTRIAEELDGFKNLRIDIGSDFENPDNDRRPTSPDMVEEWPSGLLDDLAPVSFLINENAPGYRVFNVCLDAVASAHFRDDTFTRRLANAVELLVEADKSDSPSVAFILCFAAIEAMICKKPDELPARTDTTVQIKKYVPALLMPSPIGRGKRGDVLYDLYMIRCDIVHRGWTKADTPALNDLRQIASGVIRAAIEWRHAHEGGTWEELFHRVDRAAFDKVQMYDVPDLKSLLPSQKRAKRYH